MKLYVGKSSPFETTENDLQDLFEQHGKVAEVALMMDRMTGKSRGFAFITMNDATEAAAAMAALKRQGKLPGAHSRSTRQRPRAKSGPRPILAGDRRYRADFRR